jgi:hypothetical protein
MHCFYQAVKIMPVNRKTGDVCPDKRLSEWIAGYLLRMQASGRASRTIESHAAILQHFAQFVRMNRSKEPDIFSPAYRERFYE